MNRRLMITLLVLAAGAGLVALAAIFDPTMTLQGLARREAFYRGRPTSYWIDDLRDIGRTGRIDRQAIEAFVDLAAVRMLKEAAIDDDAEVRCAAVSLIGFAAFPGDAARTLRQALEDPNVDVQIQAMRGLARLRRNSINALPRLVELSQHDDLNISANAHYALWEIDGDTALKAGRWTAFSSLEWGFSASLPGGVNQRFSLVDGFVEPQSVHSFHGNLESAHFVVAINEQNPRISAALSIENRHDLSAHGSAHAIGGTLARYESMEWQGVLGREKVVKTDNGTAIATRTFFVGDRLYQAVAAYPETISQNAIQHFLDSFRFEHVPDE